MWSRHKGDIAENQAVSYLQDRGYTLVEQNYNTKMGEIDIIMTKDNVYHFIEVKSGVGFDPIYNLTPSKLKKVIKTSYAYIKHHKLSHAFCIDAVIVREGTIDFLENITL